MMKNTSPTIRSEATKQERELALAAIAGRNATLTIPDGSGIIALAESYDAMAPGYQPKDGQQSPIYAMGFLPTAARNVRESIAAMVMVRSRADRAGLDVHEKSLAKLLADTESIRGLLDLLEDQVRASREDAMDRQDRRWVESRAKAVTA